MMPIVDKYSEMGTVVIGKVESGHCEKGQNLSIYPNRTDVKVDQLWSDDIEVTKVTCGENVKVKLKGVDEAGITPGFVLCDPQNPIKSCRTFDAKVCTFLLNRVYFSFKKTTLRYVSPARDLRTSLVITFQCLLSYLLFCKLICLLGKCWEIYI